MRSTPDELRGRWQFAALIVVVFLLISIFAPAAPAQAISDSVVISQVYGGGGNSGATYTHDFIELFNRSTEPVSLTGWSVQYASAAGSTWQVTTLSGSVAPGGYYLIQLAQGTGGTEPLPTPDANGSIAMGATAGKVALANSTTALSGTCPLGAAIIDFVGFGSTANCFEGSGPTPAPSNTTAVLRSGEGCTETDNNAADFTAGVPAPRNTASPFNVCTTETAAPVINEFSASTAGTDVEYVEIYGDPNADYSAYTILEIEGDSGTAVGTIDEVIELGTTDGSGLYLANLPANALENGTITLLLVKNFTGALNADLDTDNDGVFDTTPWEAIVDSIAVNDGGAGDVTYGTTTLSVSYDGQPFAPGGASRMPDGFDSDSTTNWIRNDFDLAGIPGFAGTPVFGEAYNTPGEANAKVPYVVISQVYGGGGNSGATYTHDFIELYNPTTTAVDITGWSVQYASAAGTTWQVTTLSGSIAPGGYYLTQQAAGAGGTTPLPTPDAIGTIAMSATAGKVALVNNTTPLSGGCPTGSAIVDFVGFGNANCFEGSGPTPTLSNTTAALRKDDGNQDTNDNSADFVTGAPAPRNGGLSIPILTIDNVSFFEGDSDTRTFAFTVSLSIAAGDEGVMFDIATQDGTATAGDDYVAHALAGQLIPAGDVTYTFEVAVNGDTFVEPDETFFVQVTSVTGATVADGQGEGSIVNDDGLTITRIHEIQGSGNSATPGMFSVEAIVTGDYQDQGPGQLRGFFIQEEDADADGDPGTSEGLFVFCFDCPVDVSVGDAVRLRGESSEFFAMSQLTAVTTISVLSSGNPLPAAAAIELPVPGVPTGDLAAARAHINAYFEAFEGMLVSFPDTLAVSEYFELARYGQVVLREGGRPHTFTAVNTPTAAGYIDHQIDLASRTVILDDTDNRQNRPVDVPNTPYFYPAPGLSTSNFFRGGDTITNLTGVLHWSFAGQSGTDAWRIRPVTEAFEYDFIPANPRPAVPEVGGSLKVASFNVLNYFLTIDTTASNDVGTCGPSGTMDCRGADSAQELERQRTKLLTALAAIDADVFGFMEMENTPGVEPLADIVAGLTGYAYVDTGATGTDAIRVGIIYKTSTVMPVGTTAVLDSQEFVNPRGADIDRNRPAVAQSFEEISSGARFTVVVNHLKSKGSGCGVGDDDTTTGQGNCNLTRTLAAQVLTDWLATDPTGSGDADVLIIGDLNSYAKEDPIVALETAGYTNLVSLFGGPSAYSYVFDGQLGYLDHALSSPTLTPQVTGVAEWHINADEVPLFDYNDDVRDGGEASFEEESDVLPLYEANEFRTSDHDPVIIGLNLMAYDFDGFYPPVENPPAVNVVRAGSAVPVQFSLSGDRGLDVFFDGYPIWTTMACDGTALGETASAGNSSLIYDPETDTYTYVWKTDKSWRDTCVQLVVVFRDGTYRVANFMLKP